MAAPREVIDLIERFTRNREAYLSNEYNEAQVRLELINPFFKALGWDMYNEAGYAEAYKDVVHEDAIKIGGATKAPDYAFRIGGARKFFVEAKRPGVDIKNDPEPAYQLRRYAWSAKLPLSILTDFEEFAVYDCRIKPNHADKASAARVLYFTYTEYEAHWDEIAAIFSREAILKGSFDKYVESSKTKRGTAEVDEAFLKEIENWRDLLARNIALRNTSLSTRELNYAVQRTVDRIIFLRICEDRGIEDYGQLMALQSGTRAYERLCQIFRHADERYNSGLFHFSAEKERTDPPDDLTLNLTIDDKVLREIFKGLYYPESPFEFSVLPADILGHIYEQFLGKVIRLTAGHQAKVEDKPEVKKAGGVYYTPTYIVDYIVKNTVGKVLEGKTPNEIAKLRVLDPACGSGSFLLGAYQYLLNWHQEWYTKHDPEKRAKGRSPTIYLGPGGEWRLTTAEKKRILLNNIYGVDIDTQAVEVTKLSLLLKVLEGENAETLGKPFRLFHERALPDLGDNIKCGNSLIGPDFYEGQQLSLLDDEERYRINAFDWNAEFPDIMNAGGFDAVIGNPPYIRIQRIPHDESDYMFKRYKTPASKTDLSQLFLERSLSLVSSTGLVGLICTSQWMATDYGKNMRYLLSDGLLNEIVDFGSLPVFLRANTYPAILILGHQRVKAIEFKRVISRDQLNSTAIDNAPARKIALSTLSEMPWNLTEFDLVSVLRARSTPWQPLMFFAHAYIGTLTGMDRAFVISQNAKLQAGIEDDIVFPYAYRGEEVRRYETMEPEAFVIYPYDEREDGVLALIPERELKDRYPNAFEHLVGCKDTLRQRKDSRRLYASGADWYRHLRPGSFKYIRPEKLVIKGIGKQAIVGALKGNTCFNGANCPGIILERMRGYDEKYLLGILNSLLASSYLRSVCPAKLSGYTRFNATNVNNTPIRVLDLSNHEDKTRHDRMVELVETMLKLHKDLRGDKTNHEKSLIQRQINATDQQIDQLVYKLYGLTDKEICIVEEATK